MLRTYRVILLEDLRSNTKKNTSHRKSYLKPRTENGKLKHKENSLTSQLQRSAINMSI
jgi:hypothetical protein